MQEVFRLNIFIIDSFFRFKSNPHAPFVTHCYCPSSFSLSKKKKKEKSAIGKVY